MEKRRKCDKTMKGRIIFNSIVTESVHHFENFQVASNLLELNQNKITLKTCSIARGMIPLYSLVGSIGPCIV